MHGELDQAVGVAPLVVIPRDELHEGRGEHDACVGVEDGRMAVALEVGGDHLILSVAHDALPLGGRGLGLDESLDVTVRGLLGQLNGQVDDRDVGRGHAEGHASELAVERGDDLADSFGGAGGGRDDVLPRTTATTPVLARGAIDRLLRGGGGVHGGHEALDDAVLVVDDLGERGEAVSGARGVGEDVDVLLVLQVVDAHDEHRRIRGGSGDDHLLGAALQVHRCLLNNGEDAGRLADDVRALLPPRNLGRVLDGKEGDLLAVHDQHLRGLVALDGALVDAVGRVVLEEVGGVLDVAEGVVDGDHLGALLHHRRPADEAADAPETRDAHLHHGA
mmetsp:Transcript_17219/g.25900  ORF Transcript_17219/g.25900 Transcript_17219/m.25900 type:complete len:334 (+) Transcript_17219:1164-2165(+)